MSKNRYTRPAADALASTARGACDQIANDIVNEAVRNPPVSIDAVMAFRKYVIERLDSKDSA